MYTCMPTCSARNQLQVFRQKFKKRAGNRLTVVSPTCAHLGLSAMLGTVAVAGRRAFEMKAWVAEMEGTYRRLHRRIVRRKKLADYGK
jgi:hypothetical protein